jgi:hypothetical protein
LTAVVLVAAVALALATVALWRSSRGDETGAPGPSGERAAAVEAPTPPPPSSMDTLPEETPTDGRVGVSSADDPSVAEEREASAASSVSHAETSGAAGSAEREASAAGEEGEVAVDVDEIGAAPPVRLVGRASDGPAATEVGSADEEPPSELPALALQGTSVIDGKPGAVINYQRLFEGDVIEGARVVKILDRAVELEFKGTRFTIRL